MGAYVVNYSSSFLFSGLPRRVPAHLIKCMIYNGWVFSCLLLQQFADLILLLDIMGSCWHWFRWKTACLLLAATLQLIVSFSAFLLFQFGSFNLSCCLVFIKYVACLHFPLYFILHCCLFSFLCYKLLCRVFCSFFNFPLHTVLLRENLRSCHVVMLLFWLNHGRTHWRSREGTQFCRQNVDRFSSCVKDFYTMLATCIRLLNRMEV